MVVPELNRLLECGGAPPLWMRWRHRTPKAGQICPNDSTGAPWSLLAPRADPGRLPEHTHPQAPRRLPAHLHRSFLERDGITDKQHGPAARPQDAIPLFHRGAVQRPNLLRPTELFAERRITQNAIDSLIPQRQRTCVPARQIRLAEPAQI